MTFKPFDKCDMVPLYYTLREAARDAELGHTSVAREKVFQVGLRTILEDFEKFSEANNL